MFMLNVPAFAPIYQPDAVYPVLMDNFCARLSCLMMFGMLCYDGIKDFKFKVYSRSTQKVKIKRK